MDDVEMNDVEYLDSRPQVDQPGNHYPFQKSDLSSVSLAIDAPNVCWAYEKSLGTTESSVSAKRRPSLEGLQRCLQFWMDYGITPIAICPTWWKHAEKRDETAKTPTDTENASLLKELVERQLLFFAPSGEHDDLYIIDYAYRSDGFVISNDKFRDHSQSRGLSRDWVETRRIGFMWIQGRFIPNPDSMIKLQEFVSSIKSQCAGVPQPHRQSLPKLELPQQPLKATTLLCTASNDEGRLRPTVGVESLSPGMDIDEKAQTSFTVQNTALGRAYVKHIGLGQTVNKIVHVPKQKVVNVGFGQLQASEQVRIQTCETSEGILMVRIEGTSERVSKAEKRIAELIQSSNQVPIKMAKPDIKGLK